ncbi:MAG: transcription antitermination factor NusB [Sumerlaeia bacterium]
MGKRRFSRESAFQLLYSQQFTNHDRHEAIALFGSMQDAETRPPDEFTARLLEVHDTNEEAIVSALEKCLENWTSDRLTVFDRSLLRLAATEMLYFRDVPPRVVINEYLEIAKDYGTEESPKFLNGVLDRLYHGLAKDNPDIPPPNFNSRRSTKKTT